MSSKNKGSISGLRVPSDLAASYVTIPGNSSCAGVLDDGVSVSHSVISWCLLGVCFTVAGFLAWRHEHKKAERLESRMKSGIRVSCGKSVDKSVDKSVVSASGKMWYRARLDLEGCVAVPNLEASINRIMGRREQSSAV